MRKGVDHPRFRTGTYSGLYQDLLKGRLLEGYQRIQDDEDLVSLREEIRLLSARNRELVARIEEGGGAADAWRTLTALAEAAAALDPADLVTQLRAAVAPAAGRDLLWAEVQTNSQGIRALKEAERRKRESEHAKLSVDHVLHLAGVLTQLALHCITEADRRQYFMETVRRIARGDEVMQLPPGVTSPEGARTP